VGVPHAAILVKKQVNFCKFYFEAHKLNFNIVLEMRLQHYKIDLPLERIRFFGKNVKKIFSTFWLKKYRGNESC
jgi:hypothetical protein